VNLTEPVLPLVVIVGPTAAGKTALAIELAHIFSGEIISADSRLFYRGMDIGTAKPSQAERRGIPHHLIDVVDPDETFSLAVFQQEVSRLLDEIRGRGRQPFLVGGTGQYLLAVIEGWQPPAVEPAPELREVLVVWAEEIGGQALHDRLALLDPQAADAIDPRNVRRTVRALEVILTTGERFSEQRRRLEPPAGQILIGLTCPRPELYERIDRRIEGMIADGLVDEVKGLLAKGYSPDLPSMSAIGYQEIGRYLQGEITLDEAVMLMKRRTRLFVRRQNAWFKPADPRIQWFTAGERTTGEVVDYLRTKMTHA
jgi:tRNA dimethylallyltransferase